MLPDAADSKAFDRFAYVSNNPVKLTDPSGHDAVCQDGDPDCDLAIGNPDKEKEIKLRYADYLVNTYGWNIEDLLSWKVSEIQQLLEAAVLIEEFIDNIDPGMGKEWINHYLGNSVFHKNELINSILSASVALGDDVNMDFENPYTSSSTIIHELGHVLEHNITPNATFFGGGPADEMVIAVGGIPGLCGLRFECSNLYNEKGSYGSPNELWPKGSYGNHSVADDFAEVFRYSVTGTRTVPPQRKAWFETFIRNTIDEIH